jgi:hypothetical protein
MIPYVPVDEVVARELPESASFLEVFDAVLDFEFDDLFKLLRPWEKELESEEFAQLIKMLGAIPVYAPSAAHTRRKVMIQSFLVILAAQVLPSENLEDFRQRLDALLKQFSETDKAAFERDEEAGRREVENFIGGVWLYRDRKKSSKKLQSLRKPASKL